MNSDDTIAAYAARFRSSSGHAAKPPTRQTLPPDLARLEAEAIHILREVAASFRKPVMLYSIGKDSTVMLHLALKAFWPSLPPFPLLHVDSLWEFAAMGAFRDTLMPALGIDMRVHVNEEGAARDINPFVIGVRSATNSSKPIQCGDTSCSSKVSIRATANCHAMNSRQAQLVGHFNCHRK